MHDPSIVSYKSMLPAIALRPYIDHYWYLYGRLQHEEIITLMPDGTTHLLLNMGETITSRDSEKDIEHEKMYIVGPMARKDTQVINGYLHLFGIQLKPGAFPYFFSDFPLRDLTNQFLEYPWRDPPDIKYIVEGFTHFIDRFFMDRLSPPAISLLPVLNHIQGCKGQIRVKHLIQQHFITERQLERHFLIQVGLSPRDYISLERFKHALSCIQSRGDQSLAEIAWSCGYYDHAHLTNEFHRYTDQLPGAFKLSDFSKAIDV